MLAAFELPQRAYHANSIALLSAAALFYISQQLLSHGFPGLTWRCASHDQLKWPVLPAG